MVTATLTGPQSFYQGFVMGRGTFQPREFGVNMSREDFADQMIDEFNMTYKDSLSIDEVLLRPRTALFFCEQVRSKFGYYDMPDDLILRVIMNARKNP